MAKARVDSLSRPPPVQRSPNKLLAALPAADYRRILPSLTTVPLKFRQSLHKQGAKIDTVYFPGGGVCSIVNSMSDGRTVEVATIGNEGVVGITVFLGGDLRWLRHLCRLPVATRSRCRRKRSDKNWIDEGLFTT